MKAMKKLLEANTGSGRRRISQVFRDFCELGALTMRNAVDPHNSDERRARLTELSDSYSEDELGRFKQLFELIGEELEREMSDVLGSLYMTLDLGNERLGQFFTPYSVSRIMAAMTAPDAIAKLDRQEFITLSEPTCGSGGMVIAFADVLRSAGANYQKVMHVTAQDIDIAAVHMTYLQLSLLYVPAVVIHGNTLTMETYDNWPTIAHVLDGWAPRLNRVTSGTSTT